VSCHLSGSLQVIFSIEFEADRNEAWNPPQFWRRTHEKRYLPRYCLMADLRFEISKTRDLPFLRHGGETSTAGSRSAGGGIQCSALPSPVRRDGGGNSARAGATMFLKLLFSKSQLPVEIG